MINNHTTVLGPAQARQLVAAMVTDPSDPRLAAVLVKELRDGARSVWSIPAHQLRPILSRTVAEIAPDNLQSVTDVIRRGRHVAHYATTVDQPGALVLHGPDHLLAAMYARLEATARAARNAGAPESLDQLRFDLAVGAITDGAFGLTVTYVHRSSAAAGSGANRTLARRRRATTLINLTVPERTAVGLDDKPAVLHTPSGDVPIPADLARALAHDVERATWQRIECDPTTGMATAVSQTYRPSRRLADYVKVRDGHTSRFPTSAARTIELDHVREFDHSDPAAGGRTDSANLAATGKRDHQAKTDRIIDVTGDANRALTYTTGTGHTYTSRPHQYLDPASPRSTDPGPPY